MRHSTDFETDLWPDTGDLFWPDVSIVEAIMPTLQILYFPFKYACIWSQTMKKVISHYQSV